MNPTKLIGIILIVAGGLGLAYGGFSYTKQTTAMKLGTMELKVEREGNGKRPADRQRRGDRNRHIPAGRSGPQVADCGAAAAGNPVRASVPTPAPSIP